MSHSLYAKDIQVQIHNVDTTKRGEILVMLFEKNGFPKNHLAALRINTLSPDSSILSTTFTLVPEEYAIKVLHDEDKSGTVTKNWTGIFPAEGLGFSNGAKLRFGPPSFDDAKLTLTGETQPLVIELIYP
jgi:uncharacterized protein (DUF2141 family)